LFACFSYTLELGRSTVKLHSVLFHVTLICSNNKNKKRKCHKSKELCCSFFLTSTWLLSERSILLCSQCTVFDFTFRPCLLTHDVWKDSRNWKFWQCSKNFAKCHTKCENGNM